MKFTRPYISIRTFLVRHLAISNQKAVQLVLEKKVKVNGTFASARQNVFCTDHIELEGKVLQAPPMYRYLVYYKPRGIETTLNKEIKNNLADALNVIAGLFPVGRLDKESEGLLFLTDHGAIYNKIIHSNQEHEKEYLVKVDLPIQDEALEVMASGMVIMGKETRPAKVLRTGADEFRIILTQGLNRQIRRMCFKLGYEVIKLQRLRILNIGLDGLKPGEIRSLTNEEKTDLFHLINHNP